MKLSATAVNIVLSTSADDPLLARESALHAILGNVLFPRLTAAGRCDALVVVQEEARQKAAATTIQSFWRAVRARHLTTIQRAMFKIRQIQAGASKGERDVVYIKLPKYLPTHARNPTSMSATKLRLDIYENFKLCRNR